MKYASALERPNIVLASLALSLNGCAAIRGIFKAGVWVGVIGVVTVIALVIWGLRVITR